MTNEDDSRNKAGLVPAHAAALSRGGTPSLAGRGLKDLLAREDPGQWLKRGKELSGQHKYQEAVRCFERGLQLNPKHADLQYCLGVAYHTGEGVPKNYTEAGIWWRKAAEQGHEDARQALARDEAEQWYKRGLDLWHQESYEEAFEYFKRGIALNPNHVGLQFYLGWAYLLGEAVLQDFSEAAMWLRKAADQDYADARFALGFMYQYFLRCEDHTIAAGWYFLAADQGHSGAAYELGRLYENGQGVGRDHAHAEAYFRQAAECGHERAQQALDEMLRKKRVAQGEEADVR